VRGRRGEQRGQAGQSQVRRPPEHGHQASPHGGGAEGRGSLIRPLVWVGPLPRLSVPVPGAVRRCRVGRRPVAVAERVFLLSGSRRVVLSGWFGLTVCFDSWGRCDGLDGGVRTCRPRPARPLSAGSHAVGPARRVRLVSPQGP
jgi:hypothetical protein